MIRFTRIVEIGVGVLLMALIAGLSDSPPSAAAPRKSHPSKGGMTMSLTITSAAFSPNGEIPSKYTCDGADISPPLAWSGAPSGTKSLALISDDPDAPGNTWVHWVAWNIPPDTTALPEGVQPVDRLPNGMRQGETSFRRIGYGGPCPPSGTHHYFFKLYALDTILDLPARALTPQLEKAMKGHVVAEALLIGLYSRSR